MVKVEITETEKKEVIKRGDLREYPNGTLVLVTDPEGTDETCVTAVSLIMGKNTYSTRGYYSPGWFKHTDRDERAVKHFQGSVAIEQIDDGKPPKQGDVMVSIVATDVVVMFVSETSKKACDKCNAEHKKCPGDLETCFTGVLLQGGVLDAGHYAVGWNIETFKKLNGKIVISQK